MSTAGLQLPLPDVRSAQGSEIPLKSAPQGRLRPFDLVTGADAWLPSDFPSPEAYITRLTPEDVRELDAAVKVVVAAAWPSGSSSSAASSSSFAEEGGGGGGGESGGNESGGNGGGRGFALLSGFPVGRYTRRETLAGYWLFGLLWGKACSNNKKGHMVGHIKDIGHDPALPETRLYATSAAQPWHNDASDLVSLLCLRNAQEGGLSSWASSSSVYNAVLRSHPHLARVLAGSWYMDRKGEVPAGKKPFFEIPVFNFYQGFLRVNISENYYLLSQRHEEVPRLSADHYEALRVFNAYAELLKIAYLLQPGDIQLLSNHTCLHHRAAFLDGKGEERRHLLRLWLAPSDEKALPPQYEEIYGGRGLEIGNRGGIRVSDTVECVPEEAE